MEFEHCRLSGLAVEDRCSTRKRPPITVYRPTGCLLSMPDIKRLYVVDVRIAITTKSNRHTADKRRRKFNAMTINAMHDIVL